MYTLAWTSGTETALGQDWSRLSIKVFTSGCRGPYCALKFFFLLCDGHFGTVALRTHFGSNMMVKEKKNLERPLYSCLKDQIFHVVNCQYYRHFKCHGSDSDLAIWTLSLNPYKHHHSTPSQHTITSSPAYYHRIRFNISHDPIVLAVLCEINPSHYIRLL